MEERRTLHRRRALLETEWARWIDGAPPHMQETRLREEIVDSWRRSISTVNPARDVAPEGAEPESLWAHSPLREPMTALTEDLRAIADEGGFVAAVTDETGTIMWTYGGRVMRRRAEAVNFAPGGRWDEAAMGTNALSLALRTGRPAQVFSAEHLVHALHGWVCYCAPIRAPGGRILGVLDLSSTWNRSHPLAMPALRALVAGVEHRLAERLPAGHAGLHLRCLGEPELTRDGVPVRLRPRQMEILTLLTLTENGMSPERLMDELYGERQVTLTTIKVEVSHLRRALKGGLSTRRYELTEPVTCDVADVLTALRSGRVGDAVRSYGGVLLPASDSPGIRMWREHIEVALREAVLHCDDPDPVLRYGELNPYDVQIHERALTLLPHSDARRAIALARHRAALSG